MWEYIDSHLYYSPITIPDINYNNFYNSAKKTYIYPQKSYTKKISQSISTD